jgi:hypothetical protein|tara:strand:+ start:1162 stop:1533 length:372 start_codon:yes stop_codon:yes gene_type:complete
MSLRTQIIIALMLLLAVGGFLFYKEIQEHAVTKQQLVTKQASVDRLEKSIKDVQTLQVLTESTVLELTKETNSNKRKLSELSGRESVVAAKPGLVEIKLNKAFNETQRELGCITGDTNLCQQQ